MEIVRLSSPVLSESPPAPERDSLFAGTLALDVQRSNVQLLSLPASINVASRKFSDVADGKISAIFPFFCFGTALYREASNC